MFPEQLSSTYERIYDNNEKHYISVSYFKFDYDTLKIEITCKKDIENEKINNFSMRYIIELNNLLEQLYENKEIENKYEIKFISYNDNDMYKIFRFQLIINKNDYTILQEYGFYEKHMAFYNKIEFE